MLKEGDNILKGERIYLNKIKSNPLDKEPLKIYLSWLKNHDIERASQLEMLINSLENNLHDLKITIPEKIATTKKEWLEIIGFDLAEQIQKSNLSTYLENIKFLLRPAYRMMQQKNNNINIGESKIGGYPDLPKNMSWPKGKDCNILYDYDETTEDIEEYAGFLAQINLEDLSFAFHKRFPTKGLLSFFCFQDIENDDPDTLGIRAYYFKNLNELTRKNKPPHLIEGNKIKEEEELLFIETYDFPENYDSIWSSDFHFDCDKHEKFLDYFRGLNFENMFGYTRSTSGGDPTENKSDIHLILLETSCETRLHIQIPENALLNSDFEKIKLSWVDFD